MAKEEEKKEEEEDYSLEAEVLDDGTVVYHKIPAASTEATPAPTKLTDQFSITTLGRKKWENTTAMNPKATKPFIQRYGDNDEAALQWLRINFPKGTVAKKK